MVTRAKGSILHYIAAFNQELQKIGQISPQEFAEQYASNADYLPKISYDPTTAKFWEEFNLDPEENNKNPHRQNYRGADFRLNSEELEVFKKNGFVVSKRLGSRNFTDLFYRIYSDDLPVFVSADAILHAWHRSYDAMLEQLEETYLSNSLNEILKSMAEKISNAVAEYGEGIFKSSLTDADYFLAVARSLLTGQVVETHLKQDSRVAETLAAVESLKIQSINLFGRGQKMDFSQFKVRGHYENSQQLQQYFRAMMWCGRVEFRIAGNSEESSPRELGAAIVLYNLLERSGKFEQWQQFDEILQTFVGETDSMTFAQLGDILDKAKIKSPTQIDSWEQLAEIQANIVNLEVGVQGISSHLYKLPKDKPKVQLPHSFTVMGQKFVLDSWVTSQVVYDKICWDNEKVQRRIPTSLDVAFAVLGNNQVVPELVERIEDKDGRKFRDGLNYQHNLAAVKEVIEQQDETVWEKNIYMNWLATLRTLSTPTTDSKYPKSMRTRAWAMKTVNTQLASWIQLRHDTILYAKQSYAGTLCCYYPAGFVEPRSEFWERFKNMALLTAEQVKKIPKLGRWTGRFLNPFSETLATLKTLAIKELEQEPFTEEDIQFIRKIVEIKHRGSGQPTYSGWYFSLFYKGYEDSRKWDAIVADVHTNPPEAKLNDPGCVLHQGIGNVDLLMIAVDNGDDKTVYAGPVLSHYEFEMPGVQRKSDSEWRQDLKAGQFPPRPQWTKDYLV